MSWFEAIAGFVAGGASAVGQADAARRTKKNFRNARRDFENLLPEQQLAGQQSLAELKKGQRFLRRGYTQAIASTRGAFRGAQRQARDLIAQDRAAVDAELIGGGKYNTSLRALRQSGVSFAGARMLTEIASRMSGEVARLQAERGRGLAGTQGLIAGQIGQNFAGREALVGAISSLRTGAQPVTQDYSREIGWLFGAIDDLFSKPAENTSQTNVTVGPNATAQESRGLDLPTTQRRNTLDLPTR